MVLALLAGRGPGPDGAVPAAGLGVGRGGPGRRRLPPAAARALALPRLRRAPRLVAAAAHPAVRVAGVVRPAGLWPGAVPAGLRARAAAHGLAHLVAHHPAVVAARGALLLPRGRAQLLAAPAARTGRGHRCDRRRLAALQRRHPAVQAGKRAGREALRLTLPAEETNQAEKKPV